MKSWAWAAMRSGGDTCGYRNVNRYGICTWKWYIFKRQVLHSNPFSYKIKLSVQLLLQNQIQTNCHDVKFVYTITVCDTCFERRLHFQTLQWIEYSDRITG